MLSDDMALLQEYAQSNSEQAFGALVSRHVNLVYSVALRQVRDPHLAEEITQNVFIILSRKAKALGPKTILSGWLCRTARYISADTLKTQRRRQSREQESQMQSISSESDPAAWNQIAPLLDEALNCLEEREHDAVVLRFFDGKQLKQVGAEMGTTEDAARMRVNRGLEKLRKFFMKKGVTLSATGISGAVAANSIQAAPAGLAATITTAALSGTALTTTAAIAASKAMGMTALLKAIIATAFAVGVVTGIYEARQAANARAELHTVQQQQAPLTGQIQQLLRDRDDLASKLDAQRGENEQLNRNTAELLKLRNEVGRLRSEARVSPPASVNAAAERFVARVNNLKQYVEQNPSEAVPEFQLIADQDWYSAGDSTLDRANSVKPEDYRRALYSLRGAAESRFGDCVRRALYKYRSANNGQFPDALSQLSPFCDPATMEPILQLYEIRTADTLPEDFLKQVRHVKADRFITRTEPINPNGWTRCAIFSDTCLCWSTPP